MTLTTYHNFDLLLTRAGARYKAIVVDSPAGEESVLFDPPFAADALPRLEGLARGATRNIGAADDPGATTSLTDLGSQLFAAVFGGQVGTLLAASLASVAAEKQPTGLRLRLRFEADAAELALLPWETLYDPAQGHFVGLGEASPILRYLALPRSRSALPVKPPLRVLALLASPAGLPPLDVKQEWQTIQTALAGLVADGKFVLERLASPTLDALQARLLGEPVHILHFIGHGRFDEANQTGGLAFADAHNRPHLVRGDDLAKLLRDNSAVRLAYLNACQGALASGQSVFTGVAQALVREGVPAAVAMQAEISDPGAIELARTFYTALAAGRPVDAALTQARVALSATGSGEWAIPVLFSRSPDNRLFDIRGVLPTPDCPYPGMVPFSEAQKDLFFGRAREIEEATARLRQHPFLAVIGPSGSGKSSLIYAGLIPALRKSRRGGAGEWQIKTMRPSDRRTPDGRAAPMQALAELLGLTPQTPGDQPANPPVSPSPNPSTPTLLFVDQFEELFTLAAPDEAQAFLDALASLMGRPNLSILLTARADFYPELMACTLWPRIKANRLELPPLGDDELWAAIVEPANQVGVVVDEALAVRLIADAAGQRGSLPLVQETLVLLWERVEERQLRLQAYQEMARDGRSGLQVAIDRRASLVYDNLPAAAQPMARRIFLRLVQFGEGRADTRRQQTAAELRASGDDPVLFDQTLARLTESRLLTASGEAGDPNRRVDIAHEALIAGWPRLQEWLGQRRTAEQTRRRLEGKAVEWVQTDKRGGLLDEYELQEAEHWLASEDAGELGYSQDLTDLVQVSNTALMQARAKEADAMRNRQRSRLFAGGLALAVLVIALVGYFAVTAQEARDEAVTAKRTAETAATAEAEARATSDANAQLANLQKATAEAAQATAVVAQATAEAAADGEAEQRARAEAARVALSAIDQVATDKERALLLAVYAAKQGASAFADNALRRVLASPGHTYWFEPAVRGKPVWSHSGNHLMMETPENPVIIVDAKTGANHLAPIDHHGDVSFRGWSPDDAYFLLEDDSGVQVWSTTPRQRVAATPGTVWLGDNAWSPDGSRIALQGDEGPFIWDWKTDQRVALAASGASESAWSADGSYLYTLSDGRLEIWDTRDGASLAVAPDLASAGGAVWSPKQSRLLVIGADGRLRVWTVGKEATVELATLPDAPQSQNSDLLIITDVNYDPGDWRGRLYWSPDGSRILTTKDRVQIWDADEGGLITTLHNGGTSELGAHWSPDGSRVLIDDGQQVRIVSADGSNQDPVRLDGTESINVSWKAIYEPWSADGRKVLTVNQNRVRVWDADSGSEIASFNSEADIDLTRVEWSPASNLVLGINKTGQLRVWGLDPILAPTTFEDQQYWSWSPDGQYPVTESSSTSGAFAQVWDATRGTPVADLEVAGHQFGGWSLDSTKLVTYPRYNVARILDTADWNAYVDLEGHAGQLTDAAWSPAGDRLATASEDGTVRVWNAENGAAIHVLRGHKGAVNDVDWSPDGAAIASASVDGTVRVWQADTGEQMHVLTGHSGPVHRVLWNPQPGSPLLVSVRPYDAEDDHTRVWNGETGEQIAALVGDGSEVREAVWNANGDFLAAVTDNWKVFLWQPGDWRLVPEVEGDAIAWSPDGAYLAADRSDGAIIIWDAVADAELRQFIGHRGDVNKIDWDRIDGRRLVSRGADGKVRLWSLDDPIAVASIDTGTGSDYAVAGFSPDGKYILLETQSSGIELLPARSEDLITIACQAAVRNLGSADWREFIAPQDPKTLCEDQPVPGIDYPDPRASTGKG